MYLHYPIADIPSPPEDEWAYPEGEQRVHTMPSYVLLFKKNAASGWKGRPLANLATTLVKDLKEHNIELKCISGLNAARSYSTESSNWRSTIV